MLTPELIIVRPTNPPITNTNRPNSKKNAIESVTTENKVQQHSFFSFDTTSNQDRQITTQTEQFIHSNNVAIAEATQQLLTFFCDYNIPLKVIIKKISNTSGYQIRLTSVNGFSVNLRIKQIDFCNHKEVYLILKLAVLVTLIDNHRSPKLAENMLVMVDATHDNYKQVISLNIGKANISFNGIDDLLNKDYMEQFMLSNTQADMTFTFSKIKEYFDDSIRKSLIDNGVDYSNF